MLAFARAKIRFKAVAGASVGALNAILWCTNSMRSGITLWRSINFSSVYPVRFCDPGKHGRIVIAIFASSYVLCRLAWATARGTPAPARALFRALLTFIVLIPGMYILWYGLNQEVVGHRLLWAITYYALWFWLCRDMLDGSSRGWLLFLVFVCWPCLLFLGMLVAHYTRHAVHSRWLIGLTVCFTLGLTIICCFLALLFISALLSSDVSVLKSSPLRNSISNIISASQFEIPAIATIAEEENVFDPDSPDWYTWQKDETGGPDVWGHILSPNLQKVASDIR
jgi:hypothetical protein